MKWPPIIAAAALTGLPLALGEVSDIAGWKSSEQTLRQVAVASAVCATLSALITLAAHRSSPTRTVWQGHFAESVGLYLWLVLALLMLGEGLTAGGGMFFGAIAVAAIIANATVHLYSGRRATGTTN